MKATEEQVVVALLGETGGGKSSLGNAILGLDKFKVSRGSCSETRATSCADAVIDGVPIRVYDTEGLQSTHTESGVPNWELPSDGINVDVFLIVKRWGRFTKDDLAEIRLLKQMANRVNHQSHTALVFTNEENENVQVNVQNFAAPALMEAKSLVHTVMGAGGEHAADKAQKDIVALITDMKRQNAGKQWTWCQHEFNDTMCKLSNSLESPSLTCPLQRSTFSGMLHGLQRGHYTLDDIFDCFQKLPQGGELVRDTQREQRCEQDWGLDLQNDEQNREIEEERRLKEQQRELEEEAERLRQWQMQSGGCY